MSLFSENNLGPFEPNLISEKNIIPDRIFKYVRHEDRDAYERDGWVFAADLGPTHGFYAVLMEKDRKGKKELP